MTTSTISEIKFCKDCKHLLGVRHNLDRAADNWTCVHPNNVIETKEQLDLVTGELHYIRTYQEGSLYVLRNRETPEFCGPSGKWYEEYIKPVYQPAPTIGGKEAIELDIFGSTELEANRKAAADRLAAIKAKRTL